METAVCRMMVKSIVSLNINFGIIISSMTQSLCTYEGCPRNMWTNSIKLKPCRIYRVFVSILLEVNGMEIVEIITFTLKIPTVPLLVGLVGAARKLLTR